MIQKRKTLLLVTCFMMIGLIASLISGCGGGGGGGGGGTEKPQSGGYLHTIVTSDPIGWDDATISVAYGVSHASTTGTYQCLYSGDWTKGKAGGYGTNQLDWFIPGPINRMDSKTGYIAQSWEIGTTSVTFHLRDGVRWENRNPTKGRAVTADDVVYSINRNKREGSSLYTSYKVLATAMNAVKVDDRTVRIDCTAAEMPELLSMIDFMYIYPTEIVEDQGDITDWKMSIGCGPFYTKEYVPGSSIFFAKNTVYWEKNPIGPGQGDQLPYIDGVYNYIQTDPATMDSLFKTGQVDIIECEHDRAVQIKQACPDAKYVTYFSDAAKAVIAMQIYNPDKPYKDLRVRQALMLAIDHQKMVNEMYGGEGGYLYWPLADTKEYANAYLELGEYPSTPDERVGPDGLSVKDLYTYNPTKAKQLLADAGYPDGFKAKIEVWNFYLYLEQLEVVKDMWKDIGVDLEIKVEPSLGTIYVYQMFHSYDDMIYAGIAGAGAYFKGTCWAGGGMWDSSNINDPVLNDYRNQMLALYPDEDAMQAINRELLPYLQEQCYVIQVCGPLTYRFWWPWVKNYDGEGSLGYYKYYNNGYGGLSQYIWIDQALKTSMGF